MSLPNLENLCITARSAPPILLIHLSIQAGASLSLKFSLSGNGSLVLSYLPKSLNNLSNLSRITTISLYLGSGQSSVRLNGPSGEFYIGGNRACEGGHQDGATSLFLRSLGKFDISRSRWLAVKRLIYRPQAATQITAYPLYQTLHSMEDLRTLTITQSNNLPFILTLNPNKNPDEIVLCPKLEVITFYIERPDRRHLDELLSMAEERALRGAKLSGITIVSQRTLLPTELFQLRKHVSHVEYKLDRALPAWDAHPELPPCNSLFYLELSSLLLPRSEFEVGI